MFLLVISGVFFLFLLTHIQPLNRDKNCYGISLLPLNHSVSVHVIQLLLENIHVIYSLPSRNRWRTKTKLSRRGYHSIEAKTEAYSLQQCICFNKLLSHSIHFQVVCVCLQLLAPDSWSSLDSAMERKCLYNMFCINCNKHIFSS